MFKNKNLAIFLMVIVAGAAVVWLAPRRAPRPPRVIDVAAEKAKNAQCVKDVCSILLAKEAKGPDVTCDLAHRWEAKEIKLLAEPKEVSWTLGPARCNVKIGAKRADLVAVATLPKTTVQLNGKSVECTVGNEEYELSADVTANVTFVDGVATAISLNGEDYDGPFFIAKVLYEAWQSEKKLGTFQADMLRETNRFIKNCRKMVAEAK
jgi:hypothetical protein